MTTQDRTKIGPFDEGKPLTLTPMPNGGWIIQQNNSPETYPQDVGAYGCAGDMLGAIAKALKVSVTDQP